MAKKKGLQTEEQIICETAKKLKISCEEMKGLMEEDKKAFYERERKKKEYDLYGKEENN